MFLNLQPKQIEAWRFDPSGQLQKQGRGPRLKRRARFFFESMPGGFMQSNECIIPANRLEAVLP